MKGCLKQKVVTIRFLQKNMQINESAGRKRVVVSYVSSFMHWRRRRDWRDTTARSFKIRFVAQMRSASRSIQRVRIWKYAAII